MSDRPILEEGVEFQEIFPPMPTITVQHIWVDEDGNTQVRVHEEQSDSFDDRDKYPRNVTVTPEDIYQALDRGDLRIPDE